MAEHDDVNESVDQRIDTKLAEYDHDHDIEPGISEERARELFAELVGDVLTREETIALIEEYSAFPEDRLAQLDALIQRAETTLDELDAIEGGGGDGAGFPEEEVQAVRAARQKAELSSGGSHARKIETGLHEDGGYHQWGAWGLIITAHDPVQFQEATIHASEDGSTLIELFRMVGYEKGETYDLGERIATEDIEVSGGAERIPVEMTIPQGTYFLTRETENPASPDLVDLKRVSTDIDWDALNTSHEVPITLEETWQIGRQPGTEAFDRYREEGWDNTLHYYANPKFGFMGSED